MACFKRELLNLVDHKQPSPIDSVDEAVHLAIWATSFIGAASILGLSFDNRGAHNHFQLDCPRHSRH